jgi:ABC-type branched-subunit amino acid transport system ATPase component
MLEQVQPPPSPTPAPRPILIAEDVISGYGEVDILHGVSVVLHEAEMVAIIGPNGAGKSTLLKAIFGLLRVSSGRVTMNGEDITNKQPDQLVKKGLSYVPQVNNVFPSMTVMENLEMGAFVRTDDLKRQAERVFTLCPDLFERRSEIAGRLSGGQRQTLALGRALMLDPTVLLLDEPSASLSPKMVETVFTRIRTINENGTGILLVEQNAREALSACHRAYVLAMGENRLDGPAREMLDNEEVGRLYLGA